MLTFIGDVHGEIALLNKRLQSLPEATTVIQVGDFGFWPEVERDMNHHSLRVHRPLYAIDGNHEYDPWLSKLTEVTEIWPNVKFVPRGTILVVEGKKIGFLGGGDSIDKHLRKRGVSWFPGEQTTYKQAQDLWDNSERMGGIDILVTHVPPAKVKWALFRMPALPSEFVVGSLWKSLGFPPLYCGHMHPDSILVADNVTILPILESINVETDSHDSGTAK